MCMCVQLKIVTRISTTLWSPHPSVLQKLWHWWLANVKEQICPLQPCYPACSRFIFSELGKYSHVLSFLSHTFRQSSARGISAAGWSCWVSSCSESKQSDQTHPLLGTVGVEFRSFKSAYIFSGNNKKAWSCIGRTLVLFLLCTRINLSTCLIMKMMQAY